MEAALPGEQLILPGEYVLPAHIRQTDGYPLVVRISQAVSVKINKRRN